MRPMPRNHAVAVCSHVSLPESGASLADSRKPTASSRTRPLTVRNFRGGRNPSPMATYSAAGERRIFAGDLRSAT
jgi:hypothetical protein